MKTPKFSLGSWAFSFGPFEDNPWSFDAFLSFAARAGYDGVEINGFHPHPHPDVYDTAQKCSVLKNQIHNLGLGISGYAPDFRKVPPAEIAKDKYLDVMEKCVKFCNHLEIETLRVDTVSPPEYLDDESYKTRFNHLADTWHAAAEICKQGGVTLVWEFEPGFWLNKPSEIKNILEATNHTNFKALFDTSHAFMGAVVGARQVGDKELLPGGIIEYAILLDGLIGHLHLIDSDGSLHDEETSTHTPFGEGYIDFNAFLGEMSDLVQQFDWWCFDFCFCPSTEADAPKAIPFIKEIIHSLP